MKRFFIYLVILQGLCTFSAAAVNKNCGCGHGVPGERGPSGPKGSRGERGIPGGRGPIGWSGQTGPKGDRGLPGQPGIPAQVWGQFAIAAQQGPPGDIGPPGPPGPQIFCNCPFSPIIFPIVTLPAPTTSPVAPTPQPPPQLPPIIDNAVPRRNWNGPIPDDYLLRFFKTLTKNTPVSATYYFSSNEVIQFENNADRISSHGNIDPNSQQPYSLPSQTNYHQYRREVFFGQQNQNQPINEDSQPAEYDTSTNTNETDEYQEAFERSLQELREIYAKAYPNGNDQPFLIIL